MKTSDEIEAKLEQASDWLMEEGPRCSNKAQVAWIEAVLMALEWVIHDGDDPMGD